MLYINERSWICLIVLKLYSVAAIRSLSNLTHQISVNRLRVTQSIVYIWDRQCQSRSTGFHVELDLLIHVSSSVGRLDSQRVEA